MNFFCFLRFSLLDRLWWSGDLERDRSRLRFNFREDRTGLGLRRSSLTRVGGGGVNSRRSNFTSTLKFYIPGNEKSLKIWPSIAGMNFSKKKS